MKVIDNVQKQRCNMGVNDVVLCDGATCLIIKDGFNEEYPYRLLNINNGCIIDGFKALDCLNSDEYVEFYTNNVKIILGDKE